MTLTRGQKSWQTRLKREKERRAAYSREVTAAMDREPIGVAGEPVLSGSTAPTMNDLVMAGIVNENGTHKVTFGFNALSAGPGLQALPADVARQFASALLAFAAIADRYNGVAIPPPPQS